MYVDSQELKQCSGFHQISIKLKIEMGLNEATDCFEHHHQTCKTIEYSVKIRKSTVIYQHRESTQWIRGIVLVIIGWCVQLIQQFAYGTFQYHRRTHGRFRFRSMLVDRFHQILQRLSKCQIDSTFTSLNEKKNPLMQHDPFSTPKVVHAHVPIINKYQYH